jgi:hypothetical protein
MVWRMKRSNTRWRKSTCKILSHIPSGFSSVLGQASGQSIIVAQALVLTFASYAGPESKTNWGIGIPGENLIWMLSKGVVFNPDLHNVEFMFYHKYISDLCIIIMLQTRASYYWTWTSTVISSCDRTPSKFFSRRPETLFKLQCSHVELSSPNFWCGTVHSQVLP